MKQRDSLFDRITSRIKNNPVAAILIAAGTVVIALSTFSDAARSLFSLLRGQSPEAARLELGRMSLEYTPQAFVRSAREGDVQAVKLFLAAGMDPNARDDEGHTALISAVDRSRGEIIKVLLKAKANVNAEVGGYTALDWAAAQGKLDMLRVLLDKVTDAGAKNEAFVMAASSAHPEVMRALLDRGAKLNVVGPRALLEAASSYGVADEHLNDTVRFLLDLGVDVNARDKEGWTALLWAAHWNRAATVRTLLDRGADVNASADCPSNYICGTALMIAVQERRDEVLKILVAKHADVNKRNNRGQTALALAAKECYLDAVRTLADNGAGVNVRDLEGRTPLMEAVAQCKVEVVRTLLELGARVDDKDVNGKTAMMLAEEETRSITRPKESRKEAAEVVRLLRKAGSK